MSEDGTGDAVVAVVLDYLPHGRADDDRPQYQKSALAQGLDDDTFGLYEVEFVADGGATIGDDLAVDPPDDTVETVRRIGFDDLSGGARSELEHVIRELVEDEEERFLEFFNEAGPITLRLHQLNLLPGIGDKLRDNILDEREREPFGSYEELEERVSGLHDPVEILVERIEEEIRDEDVKYHLFAREQ